jgi:hypothetical protein
MWAGSCPTLGALPVTRWNWLESRAKLRKKSPVTNPTRSISVTLTYSTRRKRWNDSLQDTQDDMILWSRSRDRTKLHVI